MFTQLHHNRNNLRAPPPNQPPSSYSAPTNAARDRALSPALSSDNTSRSDSSSLEASMNQTYSSSKKVPQSRNGKAGTILSLVAASQSRSTVHSRRPSLSKSNAHSQDSGSATGQMNVGSRRLASGRVGETAELDTTYDTSKRGTAPSLGLSLLPSFLGRESTFSASFESAFQIRNSVASDHPHTAPEHDLSDNTAQQRTTSPRTQPGLDVTSFFDAMQGNECVGGDSQDVIVLSPFMGLHGSIRGKGKPLLERQPVIPRSALRSRPSKASLRTATPTPADSSPAHNPSSKSEVRPDPATHDAKACTAEHQPQQAKSEDHPHSFFRFNILERAFHHSQDGANAGADHSSNRTPRMAPPSVSHSSVTLKRRAPSTASQHSAQEPRPDLSVETNTPQSFVPSMGRRRFDLMSRFRTNSVSRQNSISRPKHSRVSTASTTIDSDTLAAVFSLGSESDQEGDRPVDGKSSRAMGSGPIPDAEESTPQALASTREHSSGRDADQRGPEEVSSRKSLCSSPRASRDLDKLNRHSFSKRETMMEKALEEFQMSQLLRLNVRLPCIALGEPEIGEKTDFLDHMHALNRIPLALTQRSSLQCDPSTRHLRHLDASSHRSISPALSAQSAPTKSLHNPPLSGPPCAPLPPLPPALIKSHTPSITLSTADQSAKGSEASSSTMFPAPPFRGEHSRTSSVVRSDQTNMVRCTTEPFRSGFTPRAIDSNADIIDQIDLMIMGHGFQDERRLSIEQNQGARKLPSRPSRRKSLSVDISFSDESAEGSQSPRRHRQKVSRPLLMTTMPPLTPLPAIPATPRTPLITMTTDSSAAREENEVYSSTASHNRKLAKVVKIVTPTRTSSLASSPSCYSGSNESAHELLSSWRESGTLPTKEALDWSTKSNMTAADRDPCCPQQQVGDAEEQAEIRFQQPQWKRVGVQTRPDHATLERCAGSTPLPSQLVRRRRILTPPSCDKPLPAIQRHDTASAAAGLGIDSSPNSNSAGHAPSESSAASSRSFLIWPPSPVSPPVQRMWPSASAGSASSLVAVAAAAATESSTSVKTATHTEKKKTMQQQELHKKKNKKEKKGQVVKKVNAVEQQPQDLSFAALGAVSFMSRI